MPRETPCSRSKVLFLAAAAALILTLRWGERGLVNHVYNIVTRLLQVQSGRGLISRSIALLTIYLFVDSPLPLPSSLSRCSQLMESTQLARSRSSGRDWWRRCSPMLTTLESAVSKVELGVGLQLIILGSTVQKHPLLKASGWNTHLPHAATATDLDYQIFSPHQRNAWEWENSFVPRSLHSFYVTFFFVSTKKTPSKS